MLPQPSNYSTLEFPGLHPQRFSGGRKHLKPKDTINSNWITEYSTEKGKRHYSLGPTPTF